MIKDSIILANEIRKQSLGMVYRAGASHIGGALSMADILAVLYSSELKYQPNNPSWDERDRFILSKGHSCVALYSTLALSDFYPLSDLLDYGKEGSSFLSHISHHIPGVEVSSGSLGHGLPFATGVALAAKTARKDYRTYVLVGDGEMNEGSNWEAILLATKLKMNNLCLIIDYNKLQGYGRTDDVLPLYPLKEKLEAFGWNCIEIDGHNHDEIKEAFLKARQTTDKPTAIVANTIKGKGVSYMEDELLWHYRSPNEEEYNKALKELEK
ncbi:MAG: transketolase [Bacteroidales bacterium]|jgi:transketolase|nr:transketolase [Bacteroidales bacterium]